MTERDKWYDWFNVSMLAVFLFFIYWALYQTWWSSLGLLASMFAVPYCYRKLIHSYVRGCEG